VPAQFIKPAFGGRLQPDSYYETVNGILRTLRPFATLKVMSDKLNSCGFTTPSGKIWDRQKVSTYLRKRAI
jgi:hypothetical protein